MDAEAVSDCETLCVGGMGGLGLGLELGGGITWDVLRMLTDGAEVVAWVTIALLIGGGGSILV